MQYDETALIESAKRGDQESFGTIVRAYMPRALRFATQMTGSPEEAQDMAQEAFVKAYRAIGSYRGDSAFGTWFFRLLSNVCLDHQRKASFLKRIFYGSGSLRPPWTEDSLQNVADTDPANNPGARSERGDLGRGLRRALGKLPARQRAVFLMKHHEGMKISEIAAVLDISEGTVKSHLVRAVTSLRSSMEDYKNHA